MPKKVWVRFYSDIWIHHKKWLPCNKVFTKTVSCRVMARSSQNLVIIVKNVRHQYFLYLVCESSCSTCIYSNMAQWDDFGLELTQIFPYEKLSQKYLMKHFFFITFLSGLLKYILCVLHVVSDTFANPFGARDISQGTKD